MAVLKVSQAKIKVVFDALLASAITKYRFPVELGTRYLFDITNETCVTITKTKKGYICSNECYADAMKYLEVVK